MSTHRFYLFLFIALCTSSFYLSAQNEKLKQLEAEREQNLRELKQINALLFSKKKEERSAITLIEDISYRINVRQNLIRITNEQANVLTRDINNNQKEISSLRAQLQELKEDYAAMIVKSYKSKSEQSKVMFLLSSYDFKQAYKRLQYIKQYTKYQKEQGEAIKSKTKELQELNVKLSQRKEEKQKLIEDNRKAKRQLEQELQQRESLMASIKSDMSRYAAQIKKKKQETDRLNKEIDRLIKEAIAVSNKKAGKTTSTGEFVLTPESKRLASSFEASKGNLSWPVERGVIKGKFGKTRSLTDRTVVVNNSGVKIATTRDAEVKAVFQGEVSKIVIVKNANPAIIVRHGNYLSIYNNLSKIFVKSGDKIKAGQVIGKVFTNRSTGQTLLDFRIYKNNKKLNPQYWLAKY